MPKNKQRRILVTAALPYANGDLHLGHMMEFIQTDIWVRFQQLQKNECYFVCGDDAHGTPIMLSAEKQKISPETLIQQYHQSHQQDLNDFQINFDNFYTTHSEENKVLACQIYTRLQKNNDILKKTISQAFDAEKNLFLPDRYVKGECPKCSSKNQYGDNCESCGATYSPTDLKNPLSVLSNTKPIEKNSEHYFFCLENYTNMLKNWTHAGHLQPEVTKKLNDWFDVGLQQWDISRDAPYFGFKIPNTPDKYFYVWLDAPIGYMASFKNFCNKTKKAYFEDFWGRHAQTKTELYHFIGKDIVYFHALFWPAILSGSQHRTPTAVFAHGFLTVNGKKMSKSRGTFIKARTYLNHLSPEYLRYYYAGKLTSGVEDLDFNPNDFFHRINSDLVGKYINIASRCSKILDKNFSNTLSQQCHFEKLQNQFVQAGTEISKYYEDRDFSKAIREIMQLADHANQYLTENKPWSLIKVDPKSQTAHEICSLGINLFRILTIYLKPVLPKLEKSIERFLNISPLTWSDLEKPLLNHTLNPFKPLIQRIEQKEIDAMIEESQQTPDIISKTKKLSGNRLETPIQDTININDFSKIDLRVGKIIQAEHIEGANKLLKLQIDIGEDTPRQILAGIKSAYTPEQLQNQYVAVVANLATRKMRFGISDGMVLATGPGGKDLWVLSPHPSTTPGMRIK